MTEPVTTAQPRALQKVALILALVGAVVWAAGLAIGLDAGAGANRAVVILRLLALVLCAIATALRSSLLSWTLLAMLGGVELGLDAPATAAQLHFLGDLFLRL